MLPDEIQFDITNEDIEQAEENRKLLSHELACRVCVVAVALTRTMNKSWEVGIVTACPVGESNTYLYKMPNDLKNVVRHWDNQEAIIPGTYTITRI